MNGRNKTISTSIYVEEVENALSNLQRSNSVGLKPSINNNYDELSNGKLESEEQNRLAVSQPLLIAKTSESRTMGSGIMYKPDIFYRGSTQNLERARSKSDIGSTRKIAQQQDEMTTVCGCFPCSQETQDTMNEMMDFGLLKDPVFIVFTVSNFLTSIGFNIPYVYLAAQAEVLQLTKEHASYLLAIIGIANTVGRIILGYISDKPWVNRLLVYNLCLTICGVGK